MPIRYIVAMLFGCAVAGAGIGISKHFHKSVIDHIRQEFHAAAANGTLPEDLKGVDFDTVMLDGFDVKLPENEFRKLMIADFLRGLWFIWVPAVFIVSFAVAYFTAGAARIPSK